VLPESFVELSVLVLVTVDPSPSPADVLVDTWAMAPVASARPTAIAEAERSSRAFTGNPPRMTMEDNPPAGRTGKHEIGYSHEVVNRLRRLDTNVMDG
jgi:hypothetical protein